MGCVPNSPLFFIFSRDYTFDLNSFYVPRKITYQLSQLFLIVISSVFFLVLIVYSPSMLAIYYDRIEALSLFSKIYLDFHFGLLLNIMIASAILIVWRTRKFIWFAPLLLPIAFDLLSNGRHMTFLIVICVYFNYLMLTGKPRFKLIALSLLLLGATALIRFESMEFDIKNVRLALGEFVWTRVTSQWFMIVSLGMATRTATSLAVSQNSCQESFQCESLGSLNRHLSMLSVRSTRWFWDGRQYCF